MNDRDRDSRRPKIPPPSVRAQIAVPDPESWDDVLTPLPHSTRQAISKVDERVESGGRATLHAVEAVRAELRGDIKSVDQRVSDLAENVTEISLSTAAMGGKLDILLGDRTRDQQEFSTVRVERVRAELEVHRTQELAMVDEQKARATYRRQVVLKIMAGAGMVGSAILSVLLARGC